ncbi:MAG: hydrolase [Frankiales bacterium]|nr:hydrolase [Frankiales bacterium]
MPKRSAGLLLFRRRPDLQVLLAHPGGPLHAGKDVWTVPKGEYDDTEEPLAAAYREYGEEIGVAPPDGDPLPLGEVTQKSGKRVVAWGLEGDLDTSEVTSNLFGMQWHGRWQEFPEVDRAEWFDLATARGKIMQAQEPFLDRLAALVESREA